MEEKYNPTDIEGFPSTTRERERERDVLLKGFHQPLGRESELFFQVKRRITRLEEDIRALGEQRSWENFTDEII